MKSYECEVAAGKKRQDAPKLFETARAIPDNPESKEWRDSIKLDKLKALVLSLNAIQASLIPNFNLGDKPTRNVAPPPNSGIDSGGSPDDIMDPKLRVQYLAAIAANNAKVERLREENDLVHAKESCLAYLKAYIESYFGTDVSPVKAILESPEISNETRTLIISEISPR